MQSGRGKAGWDGRCWAGSHTFIVLLLLLLLILARECGSSCSYSNGALQPRVSTKPPADKPGK